MDQIKKEFVKILQKEGIRKEIIDAFKKLDQDIFFDQIFKGYFYSDEPIPIGNGEKFNSSIVLAKMINYLPSDKDKRILEVGTGSGYSTAILSCLYKEVVTIEFFEEMALAAKEKLSGLKVDNVKFYAGDIMEVDNIPGTFDGIILFAACLSRPHFLFRFMREGGKMIFPMGPIYQQQIVVIKDEEGKNDDRCIVEYHDLCNFTPLKGMY